jgi:uncharacterized Zn-finger protein
MMDLDPRGDGAKPRLPKFCNDHAYPEVRIGAKEFNCIGVSPPDDHPHVYLNMGEGGALACPYCATLFRYDERLARDQADPADCAASDPVD